MRGCQAEPCGYTLTNGPPMDSPTYARTRLSQSYHVTSNQRHVSVVTKRPRARHDPSYPPTTTAQVREWDRVHRHAPLSTQSRSCTHRHRHEGARKGATA